METDPIEQLLRDSHFQDSPLLWEATPEAHRRIRHAWLTHVSAEERLFSPYSEDEFKTQLATMLSVFSDDCVMSLIQSDQRWEGREQVETFYRAFLGAFEGMEWVPQALVIGPQGVLDVVNMTGTLVRSFAGFSNVNERVNLQWVISFPWLPDEGKFQGETIYSIRSVQGRPSGAATEPTG